MRFVTFLLYSLKINVLNVFVQSSRSHLIDLNFLESPVFHPSASTQRPDEYADVCFGNNITDIPDIPVL